MTRDEVRALAFLAFLVALSVAVRLWAAPDHAALRADIASIEALDAASQSELGENEERARPLAEGETLDPNRAGAAELDRLPGVGPATAERIVAARDSAPFRAAEELLRVRGIGPATLEKLRPFLDLGGTPATASRGPTALAAAGGAGAEGAGERGERLVDVNGAGPDALQVLPGIGPALAARIIAHRDSAGPFRSVEDLLEVRGIGPATLERLRGRVRLP
ncbi:MAG TPA: ComEA family DNA-binding protein [Longimicrobiales bacterium]|nr:ComEA family DNA-binding protein [Longimicrobiales bacterium]